MKRCMLGLIGAIVLAVFFIGVFTDYYKFTHGIIAAVIFLIIGAILAKIWKIKE